MAKILSITISSSFTASHWHDKTLNEAAHKHTFKYHATFKGPMNEEGYLLDFRDIEDKMTVLSASLENKNLNTSLRYPTTENLAIYLFEELQKHLPQIVKITVQEKENYYATYEPQI